MLSWCAHPAQIPEWAVDGIKAGLAGDQSFNQHRPFHIAWLTEYLIHWQGLEASRRAELLANPPMFAEEVRSFEFKHGAHQPMREAWLYMIFFRRDGQFDAMMSPLHPLVLWRSARLVREIRGLSLTLASHEQDTIARASTENAQFLQVLLLPPSATGLEQCTMLGHAGFIGRLPLFREAPRGLLDTDGIDTIADIARRIAQLRPFVRSGLQVVLVNLPHPKAFVAAILEHLDLENTLAIDTFWGVHLRIRYTHPDTRGWAAEFEELDDALRDTISAGEECGLVSISIQPEVIGWDKLDSELKANPAHLAVVMDPFEVRSAQVARAAHFNLSPWMPACEYRFNRIRREIQVIPVADEHVFGSYLAAAGLIHTVLQKQTPTHLPQVQKMKEHLESIATNALWTVLADPHHVSIPRLADAETIDRRVGKSRQITCFASDLAPFVRRLDQQLRRTHFVAEPDTLRDLARDLVAMEPNGILGLATSHHDRQVKGSLGKIIAVRWYRMQQPSGLAVSLDTENAYRWLVAGHHSREKADLLGLRDEGEALVIDVLEVKAHDEATPYTVKDGVIEGRAVGQLLATIQALAEVFTHGEVSPLAQPRREVLREHLYTALLRDKDPDYIERWHTLLADVFEGKLPVKLSGRIVHVQLTSVASRETVTYLSKQGIPITVETLSAEDVGLALRPDRPGRNSPSGLSSPPGVTVDDRVDPAAAFISLSAVRAADDTGERPEQLLNQGSLAETETRWPTVSDVSINHFDDVKAAQPVEAAVPAEAATSDDRLILTVSIGTEHAASTAVTWKPGQQSNGFS